MQVVFSMILKSGRFKVDLKLKIKTMTKKILYSLVVLLGATAVISSCSKEEKAQEQIVKTYSVSIPASFASTKVVADGGAATFSTSERIYVRNISKGNASDESYLTPDANASQATLIGDLSGTYAVGDTLMLLYNCSSSQTINYLNQDGTLADVVDAAIAMVSVTEVAGSNIKTTYANFENQQSIFKFTFKHNGATLKVKSVKIESTQSKLVYLYRPISDRDFYDNITVSTTSALTTVYVALRFTKTPNDIIKFTVTDEDDKVYFGAKNSPASGFDCSKFYTSTVVVNPQLYSVSDSKQVYFSPGNLWRFSFTYAFEEQPYPYYCSFTFDGEIPYSFTGYAGYGYGDTDPASSIRTSYFQWPEIISDGVTSDSPKLFSVAGSEYNDWRVLTWEEWHYLLFERTMSNESDGVGRFYAISDTQGRAGLLIPNDYASAEDVAGLNATHFNQGYVQEDGLTENVDFNSYIAKGLTFLPACGRWHIVSNASPWESANITAYYRTASAPDTGYGHLPVYLLFTTYQVGLFGNNDNQLYRHSVRLVRDAN